MCCDVCQNFLHKLKTFSLSLLSSTIKNKDMLKGNSFSTENICCLATGYSVNRLGERQESGSSSSTLKLLWIKFSLLGWHPPGPFLYTTTLWANSISVLVLTHCAHDESVFRYGCWLKRTVDFLFWSGIVCSASELLPAAAQLESSQFGRSGIFLREGCISVLKQGLIKKL